jgi:NitT/TauT family transport system substrate-binding protein
MKLFKLVGLCAIVTAVTTLGAAAQTSVTLNYGLTHFLVSTAPVFSVPKQMGFWQEEGLDVAVEGAGGGSVALQQLATGQVDMTVTGVPSLMQIKEKGAPIIAVGSAYSANPFFPVVLESSPIRSIRDFKGKTVAVTNLTVSHVYWLNAILTREGMRASDVTLVPVGGAGGNVLHAMLKGEVDVFQAFDAAYANLEIKGAKLRKFDNLPYLTELSFVQGIYVNERTLQSRPKVIVGLLRGMAKAALFTKENPEAAIRLHWKQFPSSKPVGVDDKKAMEEALVVLGAQLRSLDDMGANGNGFGKVTEQQVAAVRDVLFENKAIQKKLEPSAYYTGQFLDAANDFDREAVRKLAQKTN